MSTYLEDMFGKAFVLSIRFFIIKIFEVDHIKGVQI